MHNVHDSDGIISIYRSVNIKNPKYSGWNKRDVEKYAMICVSLLTVVFYPNLIIL